MTGKKPARMAADLALLRYSFRSSTVEEIKTLGAPGMACAVISGNSNNADRHAQKSGAPWAIALSAASGNQISKLAGTFFLSNSRSWFRRPKTDELMPCSMEFAKPNTLTAVGGWFWSHCDEISSNRLTIGLSSTISRMAHPVNLAFTRRRKVCS